MTHLRRRQPLADDSGASLVLALIIVTVVSLVVTAVLGLTRTNLRTTVVVRDQASSAATADGAAQAAINALRLSPFNNNTSSSTYPNCFGKAGTSGTDESGKTLLLPNLVPGSTGAAANSAAVRCEPDGSTGAAGGLVPITAANKPGNAILTLSTSTAETGLNVKALNNSVPFSVRGSIVSKSSITVTNGSLVSNTAVYAGGTCTGTIVSTPAQQCNYPGALPADPGYAPETPTTTPAYRPVPANVAANCPGKVMTFLPGYYNDAAALSDLMSGNGACAGSVWWFTKGIYYFDFQNAAGTVAGVSSGTDQWLVKDGQLLAGTPVNGAGVVQAAPTSPVTMPGACESPLKTTAANGVQFVFAGDSQLQMAGSAAAEICGVWHNDRPPVAVYGLKSDLTMPVTTTGAAAATVTGTGFTSSPSTTTLAQAVSAPSDGKSATWTYTGTTGGSTGNGNGSGNGNGGGAGGTGGSATSATASLTLSGFSPPGIPTGSTLTGATLRLRYGTSSAAASRSVTITPSSGTATTLPALNAAARTAGDTESIVLTPAQANGLLTSGAGASTLTYTSTMSSSGTEIVDAVVLDLGYTVTVRGQTGATNCLTKAYGTPGSCAVLSTTTSYAGAFYVQGTTYTPAAAVDLTLNNLTAQVLRFGIVSRALSIKETGSISYSGPVIELPDDSPGYGPGGTVVHLSVYVCPAAAACKTPTSSLGATVPTGRLSLRARVFVADTSFDASGAPLPGPRQMTVQSWAVQR